MNLVISLHICTKWQAFKLYYRKTAKYFSHCDRISKVLLLWYFWPHTVVNKNIKISGKKNPFFQYIYFIQISSRQRRLKKNSWNTGEKFIFTKFLQIFINAHCVAPQNHSETVPPLLRLRQFFQFSHHSIRPSTGIK